jgi:hypothetical protein
MELQSLPSACTVRAKPVTAGQFLLLRRGLTREHQPPYISGIRRQSSSWIDCRPGQRRRNTVRSSAKQKFPEHPRGR